MEGKETFRYKFMKSLIQEDIKFFRAKHVKNWLRRVKYDKRVYDAQVHNTIIKPLLEDGFITRGDGGYYIVEETKHNLDCLRSKRTGPKPMKDATKIPEPITVTLTEIEKETPEEEKDEWDQYIARKLKSDTKENQ